MSYDTESEEYTSAHSEKRLPLVPIFIAIVTAFCANFATPSVGHSILMEPRPYGPGCEGCDECPLIMRWRAESNVSEWWYSTTWARNQSVQIRWQKNNHNGGFVRLSLVPLEYMYNASALSHFAFYYTCWEHGEYACDGNLCGSDTGQRAMRRVVTVPSVVPDGEYVVAFLWFGGLHWRRLRGRFNDYTSCARVTIRGGAALSASHRPIFEPGSGGPLPEHNEECLTSSTTPGHCKHGCMDTPAFYSKPSPFLNNSNPLPLLPPNFASVNGNRPGRTDHSTAPGGNTTGEDTNNIGESIDNDPGRCRHGACCATSCGICIQPGCRYRKGGDKKCCPDHIRRAGRECRHVGAPCLVVGGIRKYY